MTAPLTITLTGTVVPYTRMTRRGKYVNPRAQKYLASQEAIAWQMAQQVSEKPYFPKEARLSLAIRFWGRYRRADLSNLVKAVEDAGNSILWSDDQQIDELDVWRGMSDEYQTNVVVSEMSAKGGDPDNLSVIGKSKTIHSDGGER